MHDRGSQPAHADRALHDSGHNNSADNDSGHNDRADNDRLEWSVWPLKESFFRSLAVILFLMVIVWTLSSWFGPQWILPSAFILILFLSGFFLPTFYRLDLEQVSVRGLITRKKRRWSDLRKYYPGRKGVHLSATEKPSKLENMRGLYLPFGLDPTGEHRRQVMSFIEGRLEHER